MPIWVDADACPGDIKEILYRAAKRRPMLLTLVANQKLMVPASPFIRMLMVPGGFDQADRRIVEEVASGDLVVTADVVLAGHVIAKGATALNPRGQLYTDENIGERLRVRNMLEEMRNAGEITRGPASLGPKDRQAFANNLDRWLARAKPSAPPAP